MEKSEYFQLLQERLLKPLSLDIADKLVNQHIRWFRYGRYTMSAREFTIGGTVDLLSEARTLPSENYESLADEWLATLEIEELHQKAATRRLIDPDGVPTPLITEKDKKTGEIIFKDEATDKPVFFILDTYYKGSPHRPAPRDITDIVIYLRRQQILGNYVTFYNEGCFGGGYGLKWIPPKMSSRQIKSMMALYSCLFFEGEVDKYSLPEDFSIVSSNEYDRIYKLSDGNGNSICLMWIR